MPADIPVLMLAESDDGLQWTKPDLTGVLEQSHRIAPNQVLKHDDHLRSWTDILRSPSIGRPAALESYESV